MNKDTHQSNVATLNDQELLEEAKRMKPTKVYDAVIFGFLIGIAVYSAVKNGFGFLTFLPLIYLPIAAKNKARNEEVQRILKERNLR